MKDLAILDTSWVLKSFPPMMSFVLLNLSTTLISCLELDSLIARLWILQLNLMCV